MTANIPATLVNVLVVAFVVVVFLGIALGVYAAKSMKKLENAAVPAESAASSTSVASTASDTSDAMDTSDDSAD